MKGCEARVVSKDDGIPTERLSSETSKGPSGKKGSSG